MGEIFAPRNKCCFPHKKTDVLPSRNRGGVNIIHEKILVTKLMRRYGIFVSSGLEVGLGFRIVHPSSITLTGAHIGKNFTVYQNTTVGMKNDLRKGDFNNGAPKIGDGVTMYANSMIIGPVEVRNDVTLAAGAVMVKDANEAGIYAGIPAQKIK